MRHPTDPPRGTPAPPFRLAAPPRRVPWSVAVRLLFGGMGLFAWLWFAVGSSIGTVFLRKADLVSWLQFRGAPPSVPGEVVECRRTGASEGGTKHRPGTPVFANAYRFEEEGRWYEGVSYAVGTCLAPGAPVTVQHLDGAPEVSRIAGMRRAEFGPSIAFILVFPAVGLILVGASLWRGRRQLRLLAHGKLAMGTLLGVKATNVTINHRPVMKVRFAIVTDAGARHEVEVRTTNPEVLEDDPQERILYDPASPRRAVAWDLLPRGTAVDGTGQLQGNVAMALLALIPPALAVVAHVLATRAP